jgi:regulator of nucleoside diphosphate kinase
MSTNPSPALVVSRLDCERIEALLEQPGNAGPGLDGLRDELARAEVLEPRDMPRDVITMNSTARFRDDASGSEREPPQVYPRDVDGRAGRVSILAPVGSALLGLRVGQAIEWPVPGGHTIHLQVLEVRYQPEAAGEYHR